MPDVLPDVVPDGVPDGVPDVVPPYLVADVAPLCLVPNLGPSDVLPGEPLGSPLLCEDSDERFLFEPIDNCLLRGKPDCLSSDRLGSSLMCELNPTLLGDPPDRLRLDDAPKTAWKDDPPDDEAPDDLALYNLMPDNFPDSSWAEEPRIGICCVCRIIIVICNVTVILAFFKSLRAFKRFKSLMAKRIVVFKICVCCYPSRSEVNSRVSSA